MPSRKSEFHKTQSEQWLSFLSEISRIGLRPDQVKRSTDARLRDQNWDLTDLRVWPKGKMRISDVA